MAILFDGATDYYTATSSPVGSDVSFSFGGWFYPADTTGNKYIWHLHTNAGTTHSEILTAGASGNLRYLSAGLSGNVICDSTDQSSSYSANTWNFAVAVHAADDDHLVQLNNDTPDTNATSTVVNDLTHTNIGRHNTSTSTYFDGELAHLFIYDVALTAAERTMLYNRVSPLLVRPENLLFYAPLVNGTSIDNQIEGGITFTENGTPVDGTTHPAIHWGRRSWHVPAPAAAGGVTTRRYSLMTAGLG